METYQDQSEWWSVGGENLDHLVEELHQVTREIFTIQDRSFAYRELEKHGRQSLLQWVMVLASGRLRDRVYNQDAEALRPDFVYLLRQSEDAKEHLRRHVHSDLTDSIQEVLFWDDTRVKEETLFLAEMHGNRGA